MRELPTDYQKFIHSSRYARFRDDLGRRETWEETVTRYFDYFQESLLEKHNYRPSQTLVSELKDAVSGLNIMPSMRALMTAGEAARRENLAIYNCLGFDTKILTKEYGFKKIGELRDQEVHVLDGNREWQKVTINSFGEQEVYEVTASTAGTRKIKIVASAGHDWVDNVGVRHRTDSLKKKVSIPTVYPEKIKPEENLDYSLGLIHGLIYGDGSTGYKQTGGTAGNKFAVMRRVESYHLVACKDFQDLKPYFSTEGLECKINEEEIDEKGEYTAYGRFTIPFNIAANIQMKRLPESENVNYLIGFLRGWFCADGSIGSSGAALACGREELDWVKKTYEPLGYGFLNEVKYPDETNFGKRKKELWGLVFDRRTLDSEDFIVDRQKSQWYNPRPLDWKVQSMSLNRKEEVFCCTVPTTNSFVIEGHILTGNCSYVPIDSIRAFGETLYILMSGTGVGFSVERQVIKTLPEVPSELSNVDQTIVVRDSKRGWAEAYEAFVEALYKGEIHKVDYSEVRPKGSRLMVFGGRASGPEPLAELVEFTTRMFTNAKGRQLKSNELHEIICKIGSIVVVGGVRRAALISLSNLSDLRMRDVKSGDWYNTKPHLGLANNSAAYTEKPEPEIFMEEWLALYKSKSGERGIFNRHAAIRKLEHSGRRDPGFEFGTNPCVTGDTMIPTRQGWFPIQSLVGKEVEVWNGVRWSKVSPYSTGENLTYEVVFSDGTIIKATDYHGWAVHNYDGVAGDLKNHPSPKRGSKFYKKVLTKDLCPGMALSKFDIFPELEPTEPDPEVDAYSQGFYSGDGVTGSVRSRVYEPKYAVIGNLIGEVKESLPEYNCRDWIHGPMLDKDFVPLNASKEYRLRWLAGLIDSDGCAVLTPEGSDTIQITAKNRDFLVNVRRLILSLGSHSHLGLPSEGGWGYIGEDNGTRSYFHPTSRLTISPYETQNLLRQGLETTRVVLSTREVGSPKRRFVTVVSVTPYSEEETFCYTESEFGLGMFEGLVGPQCGEIILRPRGLCNLTEAVVRGNDSPADLKEKIRLASILGTWQATQTEFKFVRPEWKINAEEERLLGVSLTGIYANAFMRGDEQPELLNQELRAMKATAIAANGKEARSIGIPVAAGVTTIKPSGTVSKLVNTPAGIHHGHAQFFINRISQDIKDPITKFLIDSGVPHEPHYAEPDNMVVFAFPMKLEADVKTREQDTALGHAELVKTYNLHWSEHAVSCTVNIREGEWPAIGGWVYDNFHELTGMSFLPYFEGDSVYKQKPLETIDELTYHRLVAEMPQLDWTKLGEYEAGEDHVTGTQELACVGGVCDITAVGLG